MNSQRRENLVPDNGGENTNGVSPSTNDSLLVAAFQFPFESHLADSVATAAQQYVHAIISYVKLTVIGATKCTSASMGNHLIPFPPDIVALASRICQGYWKFASKLGPGGGHFLRFDSQTGNAIFKGLWHHQAAVLCFVFKVRQ